MKENVLLSGYKQESDDELNIRPQFLNEYVGQKDLKDNLEVFIKAAKSRNEALDHILLFGPPGLGKTTLAYIIANEMETNIKVTSGPSIERAGDLVAILSTLEPGDVLFIDEIHRLPKTIEEVLYPAMEDYVVDIVTGRENGSKSIRLDLPPFTLVGATTRAGAISSPLRDRFGYMHQLDFYTIDELESIIKRTANVFQTYIDDQATNEIAKRSRGTPRIANRLFRRVRDFADVINDHKISLDLTKDALDRLKVDNLGLDNTDIKYLRCIIERFNGGPVGIESLASAIGEESVTIEDIVEPYLLQIGFINRTKKGRVVTGKAYEHLKIAYENTIF